MKFTKKQLLVLIKEQVEKTEKTKQLQEQQIKIKTELYAIIADGFEFVNEANVNSNGELSSFNAPKNIDVLMDKKDKIRKELYTFLNKVYETRNHFVKEIKNINPNSGNYRVWISTGDEGSLPHIKKDKNISFLPDINSLKNSPTSKRGESCDWIFSGLEHELVNMFKLIYKDKELANYFIRIVGQQKVALWEDYVNKEKIDNHGINVDSLKNSNHLTKEEALHLIYWNPISLYDKFQKDVENWERFKS